jgi:ubiquinol-cytochrome c reductase cytochrome b subunit
MKALLSWLDHRTGIRDFLREALYENVPGGARWRYVWGSTLVFTFFVQAVTGIFLWMNYSPGAQSAWESVFYIQYQMQGGWLLRGLHHFTAQAMVVLLGIHLLQVVIDGAYRAPREVNFWLGLILMQIVLGLALTGYLLPWDEKGYWATRVATNLLGLVPVAGPQLQKLIVGGSEYGNLTLTRFFALHAGVLPAALTFFLVLHVYMFRRHGLTYKLPLRSRDNYFWPDQVLKDAVACLAVLAIVLLFVVRGVVTDDYRLDVAHAHLGAELGAPADPSHQYSAARPEWYFLFLFQLLKYFPGESELWGAIVLPGAVFAILVAMPLIGRTTWGHRFNVFAIFALLLGGVVPLTALAWYADHRGPEAADYSKAIAEAEQESQRAVELAGSPAGIPPTGAITLVRHDPMIAGRRLFVQHCGSCHEKPLPTSAEGQNAQDAGPKLTGFATRTWIAGLFDPARVAGPDYFGRTAHHAGDMVGFVQGDLKKWSSTDVENVVMALSAEAHLRSQTELDAAAMERIEEGRKKISDADAGCAQCHKFHDAGELGSAPDLTGYGTRAWLEAFVQNPAAKQFYGDKNDRMPAFAEHPAGSLRNQLNPEQVDLIADWLRRDWYEPAMSAPSDSK